MHFLLFQEGNVSNVKHLILFCIEGTSICCVLVFVCVWMHFCVSAHTWYWLVSRALLRSRLWCVSFRALSSPSSRVLSSWEAFSSALSTEPWASSSACDANHSFWWACSLQHRHARPLLCALVKCFVSLFTLWLKITVLLSKTRSLHKARQQQTDIISDKMFKEQIHSALFEKGVITSVSLCNEDRKSAIRWKHHWWENYT